MPNLTQLITRQSGLQFWYPLDNDAPGAADGIILDESGNGRDMTTVLHIPLTDFITEDQINGRRAMVHTGTDSNETRLYSGAISIHDLFTVAKVDDTPDFDDPFRGFTTGLTTTTNNALLIGVGSTTKWLNVAGGAANMGYLMDGVLRAEGDRQAPFDNFHQLRLSTSGSAITLDGIQVGRDRADGARLFNGKWADLQGWSPQRTAGEARAIALYYDLKFNTHVLNGTELNFPDPDMTGIQYRHIRELPKPWDDVTLSHEYEDGGRSFHEITDTPPQEWEMVFDCADATHTLAKQQYEIFDAFWDAVRMSQTFSYTDKYGTTHTGVRVKSYSRSHADHRSWKNEVAFRLCKYPT